MERTQEVGKALREVYRKPGYWVIALLVSGMLFSFTALISNWSLLSHQFSPSLAWSLLQGSFSTMSRISLASFITLSLLSGVMVGMSIYFLRRQTRGAAGASVSGLLAGVVAPSCPSCAIGLLSLLGIGGFLALFPFKGLELSVLAAIILVCVIMYLSRKVLTTTCAVRPRG